MDMDGYGLIWMDIDGYGLSLSFLHLVHSRQLHLCIFGTPMPQGYILHSSCICLNFGQRHHAQPSQGRTRLLGPH